VCVPFNSIFRANQLANEALVTSRFVPAVVVYIAVAFHSFVTCSCEERPQTEWAPLLSIGNQLPPTNNYSCDPTPTPPSDRLKVSAESCCPSTRLQFASEQQPPPPAMVTTAVRRSRSRSDTKGGAGRGREKRGGRGCGRRRCGYGRRLRAPTRSTSSRG